MSLFKDDDKLVEVFNRVVNSNKSSDRIELAHQIASDVGRWLMCNPVLIEQLVAKLEYEINRAETNKQKLRPEIQAILPLATDHAGRTIAVIKAFLEARPALRSALLRMNKNNEWLIPE
jgi:hypothetical protein